MIARLSKGFSIIELIIVLLVSSIISMVVIPNYEKVQTYAKENTSKNQLFNLQLAIETYFLENGSYPDTLSIEGLVVILNTQNLLKSTITNPFTNSPVSDADSSGLIMYSSSSPFNSYSLEVMSANNETSLLLLTN